MESARQPFLPILSVYAPKSLNEAIFGHCQEKKSVLELNFTPENIPHMSRLHIGNSQEGNK